MPPGCCSPPLRAEPCSALQRGADSSRLMGNQLPSAPASRPPRQPSRDGARRGLRRPPAWRRGARGGLLFMPGCCSLHKHHQAAAKAAKSVWFPTEEGSPVCPPQFVRPEAGMEEPGAPALGPWLCHAAPPPTAGNVGVTCHKPALRAARAGACRSIPALTRTRAMEDAGCRGGAPPQ